MPPTQTQSGCVVQAKRLMACPLLSYVIHHTVGFGSLHRLNALEGGAGGGGGSLPCNAPLAPTPSIPQRCAIPSSRDALQGEDGVLRLKGLCIKNRPKYLLFVNFFWRSCNHMLPWCSSFILHIWVH